ncbi:MAG: ABC transporter permease [Selenomonadaceae bacterium]|nr:ABC transporter permease [Selenomonadaceae bacterium]MBQ9496729.1 ABC transporter permease [Selenomonadaceae bacterium]
MKKYFLARLVQLVPILFGITFLTFGMMQFTNDDAVDIIYEQSGSVTEEVKAAKRAQLGLDQPFVIQYGRWLAGMLTGDMGKSFISGKPVFEIFTDKLPATIELMLVSILLTIFIATPLGILAAVNQNRPLDYLIRGLSFVGNSMPNFFCGLLLIYFLALKLNLLPIIGQSVVLPALTLTIAMGAKYTRQIRAVVLEELDKPYVTGARSRGVGEVTILIKSVLRSTLVTIVTLLALSIGSLLGGTAIVETIFMWDGVGKMAVDAILMRDSPLIQAYVVWMAIIYVAVNLAADLLYYRLDPRVQLGIRN